MRRVFVVLWGAFEVAVCLFVMATMFYCCGVHHEVTGQWIPWPPW